MSTSLEDIDSIIARLNADEPMPAHIQNLTDEQAIQIAVKEGLITRHECYVCPECGSHHDDYAYANECCPAEFATAVELFACNECNRTYQYIEEAAECCHAPEFEEHFDCTECDCSFDNFKDAIACCSDSE